MTVPHGRISDIQFEVCYPDETTKLQIWNQYWIKETSRLVFWKKDLRDRDAVKRLGTSADWRRNSCMIQYCRNGRIGQQFCQHGGAQRFLGPREHLFGPRKYRGERGTPSKLTLKIVYKGMSVIFDHDREWLDDTAELLFHPWVGLTGQQESSLLPSISDWRRNPVVARMTCKGNIEGVFPEPTTNAYITGCSEGCRSVAGNSYA
jgi:hypothetical protein